MRAPERRVQPPQLKMLALLVAAVARERYSLTAATIIQNEASWIAEWLEFHLLPDIGVEHFFLYDDGSTDNTSLVLAPYVAAHLVTLVPLTSLGQRSINLLAVDGVRWQDCGRGWLKAGTFRDSDGTCSRRAAFGQQIVAMRCDSTPQHKSSVSHRL